MSSRPLSDYFFDLPDRLIAQEAVHPAHSARLLVCEGASLEDRHFYDLPDLLDSDAVLFFNNSKVIRARIPLSETPLTKSTGEEATLASGEIFIYKVIDPSQGLFECLVSDGKHFRPGSIIRHHSGRIFESLRFMEDGILMQISWCQTPEDFWGFLEEWAELPLPPYIAYDKSKEADYQTVFASDQGSVAAPTAGLHFSHTLLEELRSKDIRTEALTLHVGLGTFKPIDLESIEEHRMHAETCVVEVGLFDRIALMQSRIAVGTTVARTLESLPYVWASFSPAERAWFATQTQEFWDRFETQDYNQGCIRGLSIIGDVVTFETEIFIRPGFVPRIITSLITNFHLPKTSLVIMIATLLGYDNRQAAYEHAIKQNYRFYSFGDGMMVRR